ncbi:adhesin transport system membrane fusion protein [Maritalea mobilis]|uniref:Membrane fusion protein (MFP) family protein n=1 Tax=Maritalea mobilis TaxID=483324 RepID=A0A4R6VMZ1_9HYPH|nr:HlyD family type I secretion periplasmic adaptor subunit [Maritalea mobilis]TDQ63552.1 adhesin transport system membrane fusion protein [Maritalea mobilis]
MSLDQMQMRQRFEGVAATAPNRGALVILLIALFSTFALLWASFAKVDEISRAEGRIIPTGKTQIVQSGVSGVVAEIFVRTGQNVKRGQILVRLDDTTTASSAGEVEAKVRALEVQIERLRHEAGLRPNQAFNCPESVFNVEPEICENEQRLMDARAENLANSKQVFVSRVEQRQRELNEATQNLTRLTNSLALAQKQLALVEPLAAKNLVAQTELLATQRDVSELTGQIDALNETRARLTAAVQESQLQATLTEAQFKEEALGELTSRLAEYASTSETLRGATDQLSRTEIRSPVDGIVNNLDINTIGAVVRAGDRILDIVPLTEQLLVEAKLKPSDVAFVLPGQEANIKLTAYDFSIYGGLKGTVQNVSADSIVDQNTRETYYIVLLSTPSSELKFGDQSLPIFPGMVTNVEILTGRKTVLQYLSKPITKARDEALRER